MESTSIPTVESEHDKMAALNSPQADEIGNDVLSDNFESASDTFQPVVELSGSGSDGESDLPEARQVIVPKKRPTLLQRFKNRVARSLQSLGNLHGLTHRLLPGLVRVPTDDSTEDKASMALTVVQPPKKQSMLFDMFSPALSRFVDKILADLLISADLDEFKRGIVRVQEQIGQSKLILAVLLYSLHREWKDVKERYYMKTLREVIDSLPEPYRMTRQSFYNAVKAGSVLVYYATLRQGIFDPNEDPIPENERIINCLFKNYSKLLLIAEWLKCRLSRNRNIRVFDISIEEMIRHIEGDTVIDFKGFIDSHIYKTPQAKDRPKAQKEKQKPESSVLSDLTDEQKTICREVMKGRYIYFLIGLMNDPHFVPYVKHAVYNFLTEQTKKMRDSNFDIFGWLSDLGYMPIDLVRRIKSIMSSYIRAGYIQRLEVLQELLVKECRTLTQLRIAQAIIVYRFVNDPDIRDVCYQKEGHLSGPQLARKYLDIDNPTYKMLLRIGESLRYLPHLYEAGIDPLANGSLDKLANFGRASVKGGGVDKAIDAFKRCTVRGFRYYAKTGYLPDTSKEDEKILSRGYKRALPLLEELDRLRYAGNEVFPLSLSSRADVRLVEKFSSEYSVKRDEAIKEIMHPSMPLLPDMTNPQQPSGFDLDVFQ